jgi:hypothetical protein
MVAGTLKKGMNDYNIVYDGATEQSIEVQGDFLHVQSVSVSGVGVLLRLDDGKQITRYQGQGNRAYYERVSVSATAACSITLQLGYGYATDSRANFNGTIQAPIQPALHHVPLATVAAGAGAQTLIAAADASRAELALQLDSGAAGGIFLGDATVANEVGFFIEPGDKVFWSSEAALYCWNPNGSAVNIRLTNLRNV